MRPTTKRRILPLIQQLPRQSTRERIVFVHVPKCGGTSIGRAIKATLGVRSYLDPRAIAHVNAAASLRASRVLDEDLEATRERILLYHMADQRCRFLTGHIWVSPRGMAEFAGEWNWITVLRDPEARWFSQYFYNREKQPDHFTVSESLEQFLETDRARAMGSDYVRRMAGVHGQQEVTDETMQAALGNLDRMAVAGVLEHLDEFVQQFKTRFGVTLRIAHDNSNPLSRNRQRGELTDAVREQVREICAPDRQLYDVLAQRTRSRQPAAA